MRKDVDNSSVNQRLDQSINGIPRLNPDEQRKYLGTFRERVSLAIKIKDLKTPKSLNGFKLEIKRHPNYLLIINGNLNQELTSSYLQLASQSGIQFTIKTDSFYRTGANNYGVIYASHHNAINQYPIDVNQKYANLDHGKSETSRSTSSTKSTPFFDKIIKFLKSIRK